MHLETGTRTLTVLHSPDPDDAFAWCALATGQVQLPGATLDIRTAPLQIANEACRRGDPDVAAISSAAYPYFSADYVILSAGASVGRGYGPALAVRSGSAFDGLGPVAIPGRLTTGALLFRLLHPRAETVEVPCDEVPHSILRGDLRAGVLIHEELMNWKDRGLTRAECLGRSWTRRTGLPIPVGLVVAHRRLGNRLVERLDAALRESVLWAFDHRDEATRHAMTFSRQTSRGIGERFIEMFTNDDTLALAPDCRAALKLLYRCAHERGIAPAVPALRPAGDSNLRLLA